MERVTYDKGTLICKKNERADKLILIQQGIVEVAIKYDRRVRDEYFIIERLGRGAIINHRSFLVKDDADTDFVCRTSVSCFVLPYEKMKEVKIKRQDLQVERNKVKKELFAPRYPLALDYIFHNNERSNNEIYLQRMHVNELRVKLKNAIMQTWTKVKEETSPSNMQEMVDQLIKSKKESANQGVDYMTQRNKEEELKAKMERRERRKAENLDRMERESKDSYLSVNQFEFLTKKIETAHKRLKE